MDTACALESKIRQADGMPLFFRPWSTNLLVSVGQTTRPTFMSTQQFQWVSTERLLISSNWRWYLLQRIVYCSHTILFSELGIGVPWMLGAPGCSPVSTPFNPPLLKPLFTPLPGGSFPDGFSPDIAPCCKKWYGLFLSKASKALTQWQPCVGEHLHFWVYNA